MHRPVSADWTWPYDQYDPVPSKKAKRAHDILTFAPPKPSRLARGLARMLNRLYLRADRLGHGVIIPVLPQSEVAKLKAIPKDAGNILVGPHPGPLDAHLMFDLLSAGRRGPAVFLMAAEAYFGGSPFRRAALQRLGVIPVARGRKNPQAIGVMSACIADGWWGGIFPEGEVYFSRRVMPMEYGAVRIAVEAALNAQRRAKEAGEDTPRAILLTPFAHVYLFKDPMKTAVRAEIALRELEAHRMVSIAHPSGSLSDRIRDVADRLLETKAREYQVPSDEWQSPDRYRRTRKLQDAVLRQLENAYFGRRDKGFVRRRAMKVRMACFQRLANEQLSAEERQRIEIDIQKTRELVLMAPFSPTYRQKYDDLEKSVEYLRRFRAALGLPPFDFGPQLAVFAVQDSIDVHAIAAEYEALQSQQAQRSYLYRKTQTVRECIQAGVDDICRRHRRANGMSPSSSAAATNGDLSVRHG